MSRRYEKFVSYENHPMLGKIFKKLSTKERELARNFCEENVELGPQEFEWAVNSMFLDYSNKPRNWAIITELLLSANSGQVVSR